MVFLKRIVQVSLIVSMISCATYKHDPPDNAAMNPLALSAGILPADPEQGVKNAVDASKAGDWQAALILSRQVADRFPDTLWYKRSLFLMERALIQLDRSAEADAAMLAVQAEYPEMADYGLFILAEYHFLKERYSQAAALYEELISRYPKSSLASRSVFRRAQALTEAYAYAPAAQLYERFLRDYPRSELCADACLGLGRALTAEADLANAVRAYRDVLVKYPASAMEQRAQSALLELRAGGVEVPELSSSELYERGKNLFQAGLYDRTVEAFRKLLAADARFANRPEVMLKTGIALFNLGRRPEAAALLEKMVKEHPRDQRVADALYWTGRSYSKLGESEKALAIFRKILISYSGSEWADDALFITANIYRDANDMKQALSLFGKLAQEHPGSRYADSAVWWQAWSYYGAGEYQKAEQKLQELATKYPRSFLVSQAFYWQGRAAEKNGSVQHAVAQFAKLLKRAPYSYYGYRASERLAAIGPLAAAKADFMPEAQTSCEEGACAGEAPVEAETDDGPPVWTAEAVKILSSDPSFVKSRELLYLNMKKEAAAELWPIQERLPRRRGAMLGLSKTFFELGDYYRSLMLVLRNYERYLDGETEKTPADFWMLAYPQGYWDSILSYSRKYGQDPYFIAAIIRQESQFRSEAVSPAGARGLMQVMPATGEWVARNIRLRGFDAGKLYDSDTGINIGTWYIGSLMKRFKGDPVLVAAAYNAGPEAVSRWSMNGMDRDEFVESIPFQETRGYVKKVMQNYAEYKRIYGKNVAPIAPLPVKNETAIESKM